MYTFGARVWKVTRQIILLVVLYSLFRYFFYQFNKDEFGSVSWPELVRIFTGGIRFDLSVILLINIFYIILALLPFNTARRKPYHRWLNVFFVVSNSFAFFFEIADWKYYTFNHKRATAEVLSMVSRKGDFFSLLPGFVKDYWYLFVLAFLFTCFFQWLNTHIWVLKKMPDPPELTKTPARQLIINTILLVLIIGLSVIGIRGGIQYIPIGIRNAIEYADYQHTPIVYNTPFSILNTLQNERLQVKKYMSQQEATKVIQPVKDYSGPGFKDKNVVFIILESFSAEFTGLYPGNSQTPFLDSLMQRSLNFRNAYANAMRSIDGIPAILSGMPSLMNESIITSAYSNNNMTSVAHLLKAKGYATAFFHGATNGSMSFDIYARSAGYDRYFGRKEYNNEADYDGNWGIYDEPFLQYFVQEIGTFKQPFFTTLFTLSSHPPYHLPSTYHAADGQSPMGAAIGYTDQALQKFFASASAQSWYPNTIFVITADHCSPLGSNDFFKYKSGRYRIPILIYDPAHPDMARQTSQLIQQIDILPTVMDYLHYDRPFFALGRSALQAPGTQYIVNLSNDQYYVVTDSLEFRYANDRVRETFQLTADSMGIHDLSTTWETTAAGKDAIRYVQAMIQIYTDAVVNNKMSR